ncbi:hypothetical protein Flavo103_36900 [Flavobacterium collinsii]|uniref:hypothetical protein n=1 Tax=Flavobacterium collinsii TaxID=1114861 RepID=UPI0022C086E5|nr:hypothetical protein [Flavobacterium collinsii]GIQ60554.1 hypothetical protein Flavo103_36900 [Flavobacterium collinsii]
MRNLKFPEIDRKIQQSVYGAWGGSNSNEPPNGGWFDNGDGITIISNGSGGSDSYGSGGSWDYGNNGSYDNGGYWGDSGGSGGGGTAHDLGENFIDANNMLVYAQALSNTQESHHVEEKVRSAVNATGLAAGFTGTAMDGLAAITKEIGFTVKTFGKAATGIGVVSVVIGGREVYIAAQEAASGKDPWDTADSLNLVSTLLGGAALVRGPHSIICGGLSIAIGLVATAYSQK